jgi:hypothetical protein
LTASIGEADWLGDVLVAGAPKEALPRSEAIDGRARFQEVLKEAAIEVYMVRIEHSPWGIGALPPSRLSEFVSVSLHLCAGYQAIRHRTNVAYKMIPVDG